VSVDVPSAAVQSPILPGENSQRSPSFTHPAAFCGRVVSVLAREHPAAMSAVSTVAASATEDSFLRGVDIPKGLPRHGRRLA